MMDERIYKYRSQLGEDTVLRAHENRSINIRYENGETATDDTASSVGICALTRRGHALGFGAAPGLNDEAVNIALKRAKDNLGQIERPYNVPLHDVSEKITAHIYDEVTQNQKTELLKDADEYVKKTCPAATNRNFSMEQFSMEKRLVASNGIIAHSHFVRWCMMIALTGEAKNGDYVSVEGCLQYADRPDEMFSSHVALHACLDRLCDALRKKQESVFATPGRKICILGEDPAAIMVHEAVGHTAESDLVMGGSIAGRYLGKQVASPLITIGDFANSMNGQRVPQPIYFDDEGTVARDAMIIENGVLTGFMHDRDSAAEYGVIPTGNSRGFTFADAPLVRMRNTAILPGKSRLQDMIAAVEDGYYFVRAGMGQADTTGEFMFLIVEGYEIKNGKLGRAIRDTICSGRAFETLQSVDMVGDTVLWDFAGLCAKGQPMITAAGSPPIKCTLDIGG